MKLSFFLRVSVAKNLCFGYGFRGLLDPDSESGSLFNEKLLKFILVNEMLIKTSVVYWDLNLIRIPLLLKSENNLSND